MENFTAEQITSIREMQATLLRIQNKRKVFFNITEYQNLGLVRYFNNGWILTEKAKQILKVQI